MTDEDLKNLIEYFSNVDEKTIVVFFGDHQPNDTVASSVLAANGMDYNNLSNEELKLRYQVPYVIWANYDIDAKSDVENVSANYLSSLMLQQTNLKMSRYNEFLLNMRNEVPALNANGYVDKDGKNHELSENNEYTKLITQYQYLQYNSLMDKKHVSTDLFSVKDGK